MGIFDRIRGPSLRVHILIRGRVGEAWQEVDEHLRVPVGTTLEKLVEVAGAAGVPLREALEGNPHLAHTLMVNGERCPLDEQGHRELADGDEIYLLSPLAGG
ncbi:MAG: MoaD/ThiS family protein [Kofleriaceae bacterium]